MNSPGRRDRRTDTETLFSQLTVVKTDRTLLASLFIEVAKCLNQNGTVARQDRFITLPAHPYRGEWVSARSRNTLSQGR
jgi:hypothetical protein